MIFLKRLVIILFLVNTFFILRPKIAFGQEQCGEAVTQFLYDCDPDDDGICNPLYGSTLYTCIIHEGVCSGFINTSTCTQLATSCIESDNYVWTPCGGGGGGGGCDTTTPSITSIEWGVPTPDKVTINFWGGVGGTRNDLVVGSNKFNVGAKCATGFTQGCVVIKNGATSPYVVDKSLFNDGTIYYAKVWNMAGTCSKMSEIKQDISSCEISPDNIFLNVGDPSESLISEVVSTWVFKSSQTEVKVTFSSSDTNIASINPLTETNSYRYETSVSPVGVGSTSLNSNVYLDNVLSCTATASDVDVSDPSIGNPWWQIIDGDITTNQSLASDVPTGNVFDDDGIGGYPGVPVYGSSLSVGDGSTSSTNWNANTTTAQPRLFDYSYFEGLIPDDVTLNDISLLSTGGVTSDGYEWFKVTGSLSIDSLLDLTDRKVILFVSGDLNINNEVWVTDGLGFFGTFVGGSINVDGGVTGFDDPSLEGIYLTDGVFNTGIGDGKLFIRGSVATFDGINLQRDLADDTNPAEVFKFAPDQVTLFPQKLSFKRTKWAEVAP